MGVWGCTQRANTFRCVQQAIFRAASWVGVSRARLNLTRPEKGLNKWDNHNMNKNFSFVSRQREFYPGHVMHRELVKKEVWTRDEDTEEPDRCSGIAKMTGRAMTSATAAKRRQRRVGLQGGDCWLIIHERKPGRHTNNLVASDKCFGGEKWMWQS